MTRFAHGSLAYRTGRCTCDICTREYAAWMRGERARRAKRLRADPTLVPHGRPSTYKNWGCRCTSCKRAQAADMREYRERRRAVPA